MTVSTTECLKLSHSTFSSNAAHSSVSVGNVLMKGLRAFMVTSSAISVKRDRGRWIKVQPLLMSE